MKKLFLYIFFLLNMMAVYGAVENDLLTTLSDQNNLSLEVLTGVLALSVFGLFSLELYKNRKNKV